MKTLFLRLLTRLGVWTSSPFAFVLFLLYGIGWVIFDPGSFDFHAIAAMATWFMTLVIQRAEHRDTQAIHAKLDELLHVTGGARDELDHIDDEEPEHIRQSRS